MKFNWAIINLCSDEHSVAYEDRKTLVENLVAMSQDGPSFKEKVVDPPPPEVTVNLCSALHTVSYEDRKTLVQELVTVIQDGTDFQAEAAKSLAVELVESQDSYTAPRAVKKLTSEEKAKLKQSLVHKFKGPMGIAMANRIAARLPLQNAFTK